MSRKAITLADPIVCQGISVRTTNRDEVREETAKLGGLWQKFYQQHMTQLNEGADIYGVYHHYKSDDTGAFDVVASWKQGEYQGQIDGIADIETVTIPAGKYLVFSEKGKMPDMIIDAWETVWTYFNDPNCEHTCTYEVDFEQYIGGNLEFGQVDLYIGIE